MIPDSAKTTLDQLPLEILHGIFGYLDIPDIIQIRRVSRHLNSLGYSRDVWSDAYRRAQFIRPPGPFPSQSVRYLEDALVLGFRMDRNLRCYDSSAREESLTRKLREIRYTGVELGVSLIFGHFLLVAFKEEVRCYDLDLDALDSNSGASIVYRPTGTTLRSFHCVSAIDIEGRPFACVVINEETQAGFPTQGSVRISIYSLKVVEPSEVTLDLLYQFEHISFSVKVVDLGRRILVVRGKILVPGTQIQAPHLVALDVHTRTCFLLPSCTQMWDTPEVNSPLSKVPFFPELKVTTKISKLTTVGEMIGPTSVSTSTHLLLAGSFYTNTGGYYTHVQAFVIPHTDPHPRSIPSTPLTPSHRGIIPGIVIPDTAFLRHVVDTSTQDVLIIIGVDAFEPSRPHHALSKYGVLRLGTTHGHAHHNELGPITFRLLGSLPFSFPLSPRPSINGTGRAFYTFNAGATEINMVEYDIRGDVDIVSGSNNNGDHDHSGLGSAVIKDYPSIMRFQTSRQVLDYDPYSGRICLRSIPVAKYRVIEVFDFARGFTEGDKI